MDLSWGIFWLLIDVGDITPGRVVLGCRRKLAESELERQANKQYSTRLSALVLSWTSLDDGLDLGELAR